MQQNFFTSLSPSSPFISMSSFVFFPPISSFLHLILITSFSFPVFCSVNILVVLCDTLQKNLSFVFFEVCLYSGTLSPSQCLCVSSPFCLVRLWLSPKAHFFRSLSVSLSLVLSLLQRAHQLKTLQCVCADTQKPRWLLSMRSYCSVCVWQESLKEPLL